MRKRRERRAGGDDVGDNFQRAEEVDSAFERAIAAGAKPLRSPSGTDYGGYRGYFADPDVTPGRSSMRRASNSPKTAD